MAMKSITTKFNTAFHSMKPKEGFSSPQEQIAWRKAKDGGQWWTSASSPNYSLSLYTADPNGITATAGYPSQSVTWTSASSTTVNSVTFGGKSFAVGPGDTFTIDAGDLNII